MIWIGFPYLKIALIKQIKISEPPAVLPNTYDLIQCDSFDSNPNDGITTYNLALANGPLTYNTTDPIQVFYYHSISNANSDTTNANALNTIYTSQYQDELLYAKVFTANTDCYSMASVRLKTSQSVDLDVFTFEACDSQNNGAATFNLDNKRNEIINALNLPANVSITFYTSANNAAIGTNPLQDLYTSTSRTLYIRAESNNVCYGNGLLNLIVKPFPSLQDQTVIVCQADFPVYINTGLSNADVSNYNYLWSTNQTSSEIYVTQPGVYNVTISDPILNCEDSITITVNDIIIDISDSFTPNGDGYNDTWFIDNIWLYPNAEIRVYNRWGNKVFTTTGYNNDWKGESTEGGSGTLPAGSYYYIVSLNNPSFGAYGLSEFTGWIYLNY